MRQPIRWSVTPKTQYLVDSANPTGYSQVLEEKDDQGQLTKSYTLGHDVVSQTRFSGAVQGRQFLVYDGHGSTRALLDAAGALLTSAGVKQLFAYDAYGNLLPLPGYATTADQALTSLLYSGEQTDKTGLQYLRARYYDQGNPGINEPVRDGGTAGQQFEQVQQLQNVMHMDRLNDDHIVVLAQADGALALQTVALP